jgi:phage repressor protein C with HTH and peptisase S24 domain
MLSHDRVWAAIDALAVRNGLSPSGLARRAGLDATSFNRSKRTSSSGRDRWPSTESIAKVLKATGASLEEFIILVNPQGEERQQRRVPLVGLAQAGSGALFTEDGLPAVGPGWDEIEFPDIAADKLFALEIVGNSMTPLYRDGDVLILSPTAAIRRGDRVVVRTTRGEVMAKELRRRSARVVELVSTNPQHEDRTIPVEEVAWIARVMWVRQ